MGEASVNAKGADFSAWLDTECMVNRFRTGREAFKAGVTITREQDVTLFGLVHLYYLHPACK